MKCVNLKSQYGMRIAAICLWIAVLAVIGVILGPAEIITAYEHVSPQGIRDLIGSFGALTVVAFLVISILRPFFFIPTTPFTIASGFLFGFWQGILWSLAGTTLSAILTFFIARYLFHDYIMRRFSGRIRGIDRAIESRGWRFILFLRLIPMLPFDIVSYIAGISSIRFRDYMIGTVLGELPGAFVLVMLGSSLDRVGSSVFYVSLVLAVIVLVVPEIVRRWVDRRRKALQE
jgi:uncharacterized membrane protein YdjX (TVP38/TMEM64 family)